MHILRMGNQGTEVRVLQELLKKYEAHLAVDGIYGKHTERVVRLAQRRLGLFPPDGIAGPKTMAVLKAKPTGGQTSQSPSATTSWFSGAAAVAGRAESAIRSAEQGATTWLASQLSGPTAIPTPLRKAVAPAMKRAKHGPMITEVYLTYRKTSRQLC